MKKGMPLPIILMINKIYLIIYENEQNNITTYTCGYFL